MTVGHRPAPFSIVTVCTGNICRSPLAELLLQDRLSALPVAVSSAGTGALVGHAMPDQMRAQATSIGLDGGAHQGRQLTSGIVTSADLLLALDRGHRRSIVEISPRVSSITFTLREFSRILAAVPESTLGELASSTDNLVERLRLFVEEVGFSRGEVPPPDAPEDDDIVDPYRRSEEVYAESARLIREAVDALASKLTRAGARSAT